MSRTQLMKIRVRAPDPEWPGDGFEVLEIGYADGHTEEPRTCSCGMAGEAPVGHHRLCPGCRSLDGEHSFDAGCSLEELREHKSDCQLEERRLTDLEWLQEELDFFRDKAEYLWGDGNLPSGQHEFTVFGYVWAHQDYWGEWDGGFEIERTEP